MLNVGSTSLSSNRNDDDDVVFEDGASETHFYVLSIDSNYLVLKKNDMESVFNLLQNREENKTLIYVSIKTIANHI